jgi:hypothetical protein
MSTHLVQILLPQYDNRGEPFPQHLFASIRQELVDRFGGLTAYIRAPARGVWRADDGTVARDDIVIFDVMAEGLDRGWWKAFRARLETTFRQDEVIIRATAVEKL